MDKALGWRFKLYELRAFYATYMSLKGIPGQVIVSAARLCTSKRIQKY